MKINTSELDCFILTYDEPNKERHWAMLQDIAPWAQRVDGVKGFDAAHKRCAELSTTEYLITVDGDNVVQSKFFNLEFELPIQYADCVLSWNSVNAINGLVYGNGGVKIWPKRFLQQMRSHENAVSSTHAVDFCWDEKYLQLNNVYSTTYPNGSPLQAFRAGFREGCKMSLDRGRVSESSEMVVGSIHKLNLTRLQLWGSIGADVDNGIWAILGTRAGMHYTNVQREDITIVRDYSKFSDYAESWLKTQPAMMGTLLEKLRAEIFDHTGLEFYDFNPKQSAFFKSAQPRHPFTKDVLVTEHEVLNNV